jgi:hypothetical protein
MKLTEHFSLEEMTVSQLASRNGWDNNPDAKVINNLTRLANLLEQVRKVINKPIIVNSAYRSKIVNDAVGSKDSSQHRLGAAADIRVSGMSVMALCEAIKNSDIQFDQCIAEYNSWVHLSVPNKPTDTPRNQMLIIDRSGTRPYS